MNPLSKTPRSAVLSVRPVAAAAVALLTVQASAMEIDVGNPDVKLNWDNTVKYSAAARVGKPEAGLLANPNTDDGNRNFGRGLVSSRLDLLSEMDLQYRNVGLRLSGAAWYDSVYNRTNDNPGLAGGAFPNQVSVPYNQFTDETRKLHGRKAEMLDAFVFGAFQLGESRLSVRAGKHAVQWGESLFFGSNAIAGAQGPIDVIKGASVPGTQFKELIRPVPQLSAQWQVNSKFSLGAYYQFRWEANRLPGTGSYFSVVDGEQILLPQAAQGGAFLDGNAPLLADLRAKDSGQGGVQMRFRGEDTDYGAYLVRFHNKSFQQVPNVGVRSVLYVPGAGCVVPGSMATGPSSCGMVAPLSSRLVYHEGITALGFSASRTFEAVNIAGEISYRHNMDLASTRGADASALGGLATNNSDNPAYAVGNTLHVNVSSMWTLPITPLFNEASLTSEIAWNRVLKVTKNPGAVDLNATRDAVAVRMLFEPTYRQVATGLDIGVPIGLGWSPKGSRSMALGAGAMPAEGGGDFSIGLNGAYLDAWRFSVAYTHYFGSADTFLTGTDNRYSYKQTAKDRDFVSVSLRRTF
jgi:Protein of unknown function (DUF1302)